MSTCPEMARLDPATAAQLESVDAELVTDDQGRPLCDFDLAHDGVHWSIAKHGAGGSDRAGDLWLRWPTDGQVAIVEQPPCESTPPGEDNDGPFCVLPELHPGLHNDGGHRRA